MTRVMVIGNAGGGKSTLCRLLSAAYGLPHLAIDQIQWKPGWVPAPEDEFRTAHEEWLGRERWLIDGYGSWASVERRLAACDTVVLVDHPIRVHFWWAAKRQLKSLIFGRPDGPPGCPMYKVTLRLIRMMWWLHREMRPKLLAAIQRRAGNVDVIHIRSPRELREFTDGLAMRLAGG